MLKIITILSLAFLVDIIEGASCNKHIQVTSQNYICTYTVLIKESDCSDPQFIQCEVVDTSTKTPFDTINYDNESLCATFCCNNPTPKIQFCPSTNVNQAENSSKKFIIVAASFTLIITISLVIFCVCKYHQDIAFLCCPRKNSIINIENIHQNETLADLDGLSQKKWSKTKELEQMDCAVCLCESPNVMLSCGHIFHSACICQCLKRKYQCVLCRSQRLESYLIYCHCKKSYKQITLYELYKVDKQIYCENCQLNNIQEG